VLEQGFGGGEHGDAARRLRTSGASSGRPPLRRVGPPSRRPPRRSRLRLTRVCSSVNGRQVQCAEIWSGFSASLAGCDSLLHVMTDPADHRIGVGRYRSASAGEVSSRTQRPRGAASTVTWWP
jgi:hypothetical protein